jgi:hypothetical protein
MVTYTYISNQIQMPIGTRCMIGSVRMFRFSGSYNALFRTRKQCVSFWFLAPVENSCLILPSFLFGSLLLVALASSTKICCLLFLTSDGVKTNAYEV